MMNHSGQDVSFDFLGLSYSVRAHEMHHRLGKVRAPPCLFDTSLSVDDWAWLLGQHGPTLDDVG